ncbi:Ras-related protein Rab-24 [Halotydeus destructor]|nr:Ras-related protein Rab-24 [Halotydeus destructor]
MPNRESRVDMKVVLLGKEYGGKTSLLERFINQRFVEKSIDKYQATIGAAYASSKVTVDRKSVTMAIWDTAGSERYESLSKQYYRNARAAIVCFDLSDATSFEKAKFWFTEVITREVNCNVYLCGTKHDLVERDTERRAISAKTISSYAAAIGAKYFETSSKTSFNVNALFHQVAKDYLDFQMETEERGIRLGNFTKNSDCLRC